MTDINDIIKELGVSPSGMYADVRARLDVLEARINNPLALTPISNNNEVFIGVSGVSIRVGSGDPTVDGYADTNGSLYLRTDGYSTLGMYVRRDGYWNLINTNDNTINVKIFGAKGNNSTDDTAAINAALVAAGILGGVTYFPSGIYKTSSDLSVPSNVIIKGDGYSSVISSSFGRGVHFNNVSRSGIRDIKIDMQNPASIGTIAVGIRQGSSYITVERVSIINASQYGILVGDTGTNGGGDGHIIKDNVVDMRGCLFTNIATNVPIGIEIFPRKGLTGYYADPGIIIDGNTVIGQSGAMIAGIKTNSQKGARITNNYVVDITGTIGTPAEGGIIAFSSDSAIIANNYVRNTNSGITMSGGIGTDNNKRNTNIIVKGNIIDTFQTAGVFSSDGFSGFIIDSNIITGVGTAAIQLDTASISYDEGIISDNKINKSGILATQDGGSHNCPNLLVSNNRIIKAGGNAIDLSGTDSVVNNNHITSPVASGIVISGVRALISNNKILNPNTGNTAARAGIVSTTNFSQIFGNHIENISGGDGYAQYGIYLNNASGTQHRDNRILNMVTENIFSASPTSTDPRAQEVHLDYEQTTAAINASENTLKSITYPAGYFTPSGGIRIKAAGGTAGSGSNKNIRIYFGTSKFFDTAIATPGDSWLVDAVVFGANAEGAQRYEWKFYRAGVFIQSDMGVLAENTTTGPVIVKVTGQKVTGSDTITQTIFSVERFA